MAMAGGHAKTGSVSIALKVYLLALFVGSLFLSNKTRQEPSLRIARDKLPRITARFAMIERKAEEAFWPLYLL